MGKIENLIVRGNFYIKSNWLVLELIRPCDKKNIKIYLTPTTSQMIYKQVIFCQGCSNSKTKMSIDYFTCHYRLGNDGNKKISLNRLFDLLINFKPVKSDPVFPVKVNIKYLRTANGYAEAISTFTIDFYARKNFQGTYFTVNLKQCSNCVQFFTYTLTIDNVVYTKCLTPFDIARLFIPKKEDE